jgi:NAD(P)-dependent dehydrogenase (short-subunit alcohol dehydrogenase family)
VTVPGTLLLGDVAVVTGAAQGNGEQIAHGLAAHGAAVAVVDLNLTGAEVVASAIRSTGAHAQAYQADVADPAACHALADRVAAELGAASVLVNNAGILQRVPTGDEAFLASMESHFRVNVLGVATMVQAFLPQLRATSGRVVNVGSIASFLATPGGGGYGASKGAVRQLTKVLALELAPEGIRVNAVAPGVMVTAMTEPVRTDPARAARFLAHTPLGRFGDPSELVGPVVFLASGLSSYVTGVMLPVDGGYLVV